MTPPIVNPRIIPAPDADEIPARRPAPGGQRAGIDYAALVRRARLRGDDRTGRGARTPHDVPPDAAREAPAERQARGADVDVDDAAPQDRAAPSPVDAQADALRERHLDALAAPFLTALSRQEARVAGLMHFLADRIADFCTDEAVAAHGNWSIHLRIDPALLPECALHLTLSHFDLVLRFETPSEPVRALICRHEDTLKQRLVSLLAHLRMPREVAIETR
ncbi:type III secretion system protein SctP [Burkholderia ambifaria]|uniref:type III secretion system protein SctP n=1 Tax=Burkholderia ambifaria TaxID=152480 RepID=UPI00158DABB0|nr:type III secretion system protein SctP [Burkholderia ambifaria]